MKQKVPDQSKFDGFLSWLNSDREEAAREYVRLHERLTTFFAGRSCSQTAEMASETLDIAVEAFSVELMENYSSAIQFVIGIARNVLRKSHASQSRRRFEPLNESLLPSISAGVGGEDDRLQLAKQLQPEEIKELKEYYDNCRNGKPQSGQQRARICRIKKRLTKLLLGSQDGSDSA